MGAEKKPRAGWQPIETAPKDGRSLWLVEDGGSVGLLVPHQFMGYWLGHACYDAGGYWSMADRTIVTQPTHWMPLPDPPKQTKRGKR